MSGFLVNSPEETAERSLKILNDPELGKRLGRAGKEYVRTHFLMPRLLRDWLRIFTELLSRPARDAARARRPA